jgi:hypothetical protein
LRSFFFELLYIFKAKPENRKGAINRCMIVFPLKSNIYIFFHQSQHN